MNSKNFKLSLMAFMLISFVFTSCKKDDPEPTPPKLRAIFSAEGYLRPAPSTVSFINKSTNAVSYSWEFGDGATSTEENPSHEYAAKGKYEVKLTATDANGETDVKTKEIEMYGTIKGVKLDAVFIYAELFGADLDAQNHYDSDGSGADVMMKIFKNGTEVFTPTGYFPDYPFGEHEIAVMFDETTGLPYECTSLTDTYSIKVYDYEGTVLNLIKEFSFTVNGDIVPEDEMSFYPAAFELDNGTVACNITWVD